MKKKLVSQFIIIFCIALVFVSTDLFIYLAFTNRCINDYSSQMRAKSIEVDEYLPFAENTKIVKKTYNEKLSGDLPKIDGAAALFPLMSSFVYSLYPENSVEYVNNDFTDKSALQYHNTRGAFKGLADKTIDIAICASPNNEQIEYATSKGVEFEQTPIGKEAFVFFVNKNNKVDNLSMEQLKNIYKGNIVNWNEVGGPSRSINVLKRNEGSGSQTALEKLIGDDIKFSVFNPFGAALGFSFRYYVDGLTEHSNIKLLSLNGVYPSKENVQNNTYPIVSNFYAFTRKGETNPNVQKVLDFILSSTGQEIVDETGYVGV